MAELVGDFETIRRGDEMAVWLFDLCDIYTLEHKTFTSIDEGLSSITEDTTLYFHNLKFDGSYILDYLLRSGYRWVDEPRFVKTPKTMNFLITDSGIWFTGKIMTETGVKIKFRDSFKKIPLSVKVIAQSYKLPILKGEIDYTMPRPEGYIPTEAELAYIHNDTEIVARALKIHFDQGLTELTAPADAFKMLKRTVCDNFRKLGIMYMRDHDEVEAFCRRAYCGGISWVNPDIQEQEVGAGVVYDVNSLYPSVMDRYPYPVYYPTKVHDFSEIGGYLWIASFTFRGQKLSGKLPTLRANNQWVEDSYDGIITITSIDYETIIENYRIDDLTFIEGYRWAHSDDLLFHDFVKYWGDRKQQDTGGLRQVDKLMLNSSYGKFGLNPDRCRKQAVYDAENKIVKYTPMKDENGDKKIEHDKCNNVAIAAFVTAYARRELNRGVNASTGFCYCDTDSVHLATYKDKKTGQIITPSFGGEVHPVKLGAWKRESEFIRARYLRQKTYIEETRYNEFDVKACGMPASSKAFVRWDNLNDNFRMGATFPGKLMPKVRPGGIELVETDFTICSPRIRF